MNYNNSISVCTYVVVYVYVCMCVCVCVHVLGVSVYQGVCVCVYMFVYDHVYSARAYDNGLTMDDFWLKCLFQPFAWCSDNSFW